MIVTLVFVSPYKHELVDSVGCVPVASLTPLSGRYNCLSPISQDCPKSTLNLTGDLPHLLHSVAGHQTLYDIDYMTLMSMNITHSHEKSL